MSNMIDPTRKYIVIGLLKIDCADLSFLSCLSGLDPLYLLKCLSDLVNNGVLSLASSDSEGDWLVMFNESSIDVIERLI